MTVHSHFHTKCFSQDGANLPDMTAHKIIMQAKPFSYAYEIYDDDAYTHTHTNTITRGIT
jgi:hypothetical protein